MSDLELSLLVLTGTVLLILACWVIALMLRHWSRIAWRTLPPLVRRLRNWRPVSRMRAAARRRAPGAYRFAAGRLAPNRFAGLPLTLIVIAAAYIAALFGGLVEELLEAEEIVAIDASVNGWFEPFRVSPLVHIVGWITTLGDSATLVAVAIVATGFLWAFGAILHILPLWITVLGANATTWAGKFAFDRPRPDFTTGVTAISASFPSAHATGAMAVYGIVAYALARSLAHGRARFEILFWSGALIALIAVSRIYLSVHYASDVAAGLLVGGFWLLIGVTTYELRRSARRREGVA